MKKFSIVLMLLLVLLVMVPSKVYATEVEEDVTVAATEAATVDSSTGNGGNINIGISTNDGSDMAAVLKMLLVLTVLALAPSIVILLTSFTRIIVVLHFVRTAVGTQTTPPNQVLIGLALFITFFVMSPVLSEINTTAIEPLSRGEIQFEQAIETGIEPLRKFMFNQTSQKDIATFIEVANMDVENIENLDDIPTSVLIPSFIISELRIAFIIGFLIYIPFIIIDMVVASTLMSMGMMMLPPTTISLPFKILLFVLADGWNLIIGNLVSTFYV